LSIGRDKGLTERMAFLKTGFATEATPQLRAHGLVLRPPLPCDYQAWAELRDVSRKHLIPWEPQWSRDELSRWAFRRRLRYYQRDQRDDLGCALFIFSEHTGALMGGLTLSNIRRGVTQAAALGYWLGEEYTGDGHMCRAVSLALDYAFSNLRLHRIEAACLPRNAASIAVLRRNGFQEEGLARRYLKINGAWCDHLLFALLSDDPRLGKDGG
jgi:ribosomal-protein-alanine N-acetyltransferase